MSPKKVLVIKLRHLGDVLLTSPVFSNLKRAYPDAEIDAYIWKEARPILEGHPAIDGFILHDRSWKRLPFFKRLREEWGLLRAIRKKNYDMVVHLTEGDRGALAAWVSGAKKKVAVDPHKKWKRKIFTELVKHCPNPRHTVEKDLDAVRKLGLFPTDRELVFVLPQTAIERAKELAPNSPFILVHPVSRWKFKCPPKEVIAKSLNVLQLPVVMTGAASEREFVQAIADSVKTEVYNLAGEISLKELGALMQLAQGVITVDSVSLHIASALKVPVVALFGPTSEENWGPWRNPNARVVVQNLPCRPCRLDGCGGSKMSDCLWTLPFQDIVQAYCEVTGSELTESSSASLRVLNSFETNFTE